MTKKRITRASLTLYIPMPNRIIQGVAQYTLILSNDAEQTMYHATSALHLATEVNQLATRVEEISLNAYL